MVWSSGRRSFLAGVLDGNGDGDAVSMDDNGNGNGDGNGQTTVEPRGLRELGTPGAAYCNGTITNFVALQACSCAQFPSIRAGKKLFRADADALELAAAFCYCQ